MLTLYAEHLWDSPFVFSVLVTLEEKRLPYELRVFDLSRAEHQDAAFQRASLTGRVPAIDHDGFWLTESQVIVEYLEDTFSPPAYSAVLPSTPHERARARQVLAWLRSDLHRLRADRSTETMFYERANAPLSAGGQADADKLVSIATLLLEHGGPTIFGTWSVVDADLAFMLARLTLNRDALPERLERYVEATWQRPSVRRYLDQPRPPTPH